MITIPPAVSSPPTNTSPELPKNGALTSLDFLRILVAEFQNQDPTQPSDPTQFASQLVQFSNLGQLEGIKAELGKSPASGLMQAASAFIGREVVAPGSAVGVKGGKATSIVYAPGVTDSYKAMVYDAAGNPVDTVSLGTVQGGAPQTFAWQPSSSVSDGVYAVKIVDSRNVALSGLLEQGVVQNVSLSDAGVTLDLGNLPISQDAVQKVAQP